MSQLTHGGLCNGIAGFALAAQRAGIRTIWTSDTDPFCNAVSRKHFPHAHQYGNIYDVHHPQRPDIISAGYPCQPESYAGKRQGTEDDRWLWPEVLRLVTECRPGWFIGENVAGHVTLGLSGVLADLEAAGYEVWPLVLPACALGAPHQRDRVWIIAHTDNRQPEQPQQALRAGRHPAGLGGKAATDTSGGRWGADIGDLRGWQPDAVGCCQATTYTHSSRGRPGQPERPEARAEADYSPATNPGSSHHVWRGEGPRWWQQCAESLTAGIRHRQDFQLTQPALRAPDDGLSVGLVRPDTGGDAASARRAKADEKTWRRSTLHAAGNALVPQIPTLFFQFIADYEAGLIQPNQ